MLFFKAFVSALFLNFVFCAGPLQYYSILMRELSPIEKIPISSTTDLLGDLVKERSVSSSKGNTNY